MASFSASQVLNSLAGLTNTPSSASSATLKPVATSAPKQSSQPQVTNTPVVKQNGGWYNGVQYWSPGQAPSTPSNNSQPSNNSSQPSNPLDGYDFNALYQPQIDALTAAEGTANSNADLSMQDVATSANSSKRDITDQETQANQTYQTAEDKLSKNKQSAYEEAIRAYNVLKQNGVSRFGGGSSAGQAVGEIGQQEFFRNQGNIDSQFQQNFADAQTQWNNTLKAFSTAKMKVDDEVLTAQNAIKRQLSDQLTQIKMAKGQVESDKTAKKLEVLDRAQQQLQAINLAKQQADIQLKQFKDEQTFMIQNNLIPSYKNNTVNTGISAPETSTIGNTTSTTPTIAPTYNPNSKYDIYGNLITQ